VTGANIRSMAESRLSPFVVKVVALSRAPAVALFCDAVMLVTPL